MSTLDNIRQPVAEQLADYEKFLTGMLGEQSAQLKPLVSYIFSNRGKAVRPLVVMLAAGLYPSSARRDERARTAAMLIEMVHTASLIHDDIIDEAYIRRSGPSVNALWGDHMAVLMGDYIIARGFAEGMRSGHYDIVGQISDSLYALCEGEMLQSRQSDRLQMTREIYFDIIHKKTAMLLGTSGAAGAMAADAPANEVASLRCYAENLGYAFQIRDDVLDYAPTSQTGKPTCSDLKERKINLPLLAVLENSDGAVRRELLRKLSDVRRHPENVDFLHKAVLEGRGIVEASATMDEFLNKARGALDDFDALDCRTALLTLCDYVATRDK